MIYLDTHVLVLLFLGQVNKLGRASRAAIDEGDPVASPAAILELQYLHEIGRLKPTVSNVVKVLVEGVGLRICELPFHLVVENAMAESWGRDPFDRLIVANAKTNEAPLVTKDERIQNHYSRAIW
jgi:PIN domain nuclease of toxin-antitoxin system